MDQIFESKKNTTNLVGQINPTFLVGFKKSSCISLLAIF
tara:strand:+ start:1174 stop:1290 length:117 start_codon:yes stop_codon:yes gene_type:complete